MRIGSSWFYKTKLVLHNEVITHDTNALLPSCEGGAPASGQHSCSGDHSAAARAQRHHHLAPLSFSLSLSLSLSSALALARSRFLSRQGKVCQVTSCTGGPTTGRKHSRGGDHPAATRTERHYGGRGRNRPGLSPYTLHTTPYTLNPAPLNRQSLPYTTHPAP